MTTLAKLVAKQIDIGEYVTYVFEVVLDGEIVLATGTGKSKKDAQQDAAKNALEKCVK